MRYGLMVAVAGLAIVFGGAAGQAAPLGVAPALDNGSTPQIELVRGGCGFGAHRGWYGHCHYNHGWRGRVRARV